MDHITVMTKLKYSIYLVLALLVISEFTVEALIVVNKLVNSLLLTEILGSIQNTTYYLWERFTFVVTGMVILANHSSLRRLHIDRNVLVLYVATGIMFGRYYFWPVGWLGLFLAGLIVYMLAKGKFNLDEGARPSSAAIIAVFLSSFGLYWLFKIRFVGPPAINQYMMIFLLDSPFAVVEEVIFRGLLWMGLEALGWRQWVIVLVQALFFWVAHIHYILSNPFLFWAEVPFLAVLFGILVWRYKSIGPSSVAHILFNLR